MVSKLFWACNSVLKKKRPRVSIFVNTLTNYTHLLLYLCVCLCIYIFILRYTVVICYVYLNTSKSIKLKILIFPFLTPVDHLVYPPELLVQRIELAYSSISVLRAKFKLYMFLSINLKAFGCEPDLVLLSHSSVIEDIGRIDQ